MKKTYYNGRLTIDKKNGNPAMIMSSGLNKRIEIALEQTAEIEFDFNNRNNPLTDIELDVIYKMIQGKIDYLTRD